MKRDNRIIAVVFIVLFALTPALAGTRAERERVFDQVWMTVKDNFFDPSLRDVDWNAARERYRKDAVAASSTDGFADIVNRMLSELETSHTHYYTPNDPEYYQLAAIFWPYLEKKLKPFLTHGSPEYVGIGVSTEKVDNKTFVRAVFDGLPAAAAGVKEGDQIIDVDGKLFQPIRSFVGKEGKQVRLNAQRGPDAGSRKEFVVTPKRLNPATMFLDAMKASVEVMQRDGKTVGYVHVWSYAGEVYQDQLVEELNGRLRDANGLVLDLRDGWGGANTNYLWSFVAPPLSFTIIARDKKRTEYQEAWTKPVALLINEGSRSGKELFAYYFQKAHRGPLIGSRTAGAVMAGKMFVMDDGSLLYLAVDDILVDNHRLEGHGVTPDIGVPYDREYSGGADPQKQRAVAEVAKKLRE